MSRFDNSSLVNHILRHESTAGVLSNRESLLSNETGHTGEAGDFPGGNRGTSTGLSWKCHSPMELVRGGNILLFFEQSQEVSWFRNTLENSAPFDGVIW